MFPSPRWAALAALCLVAGCSGEHPSSTGPAAAAARPPASMSGQAERAGAEALARMLARALADPEVRATWHRALAASRVREGKLHLQRLLSVPGSPALRGLARANQLPEAAVLGAARAAIPLELYLPVTSHREAWQGGDDYLVATALGDRDTPVAWDRQGRRHLLSPAQPPATPVLALVPVETDFDGADVERAECVGEACSGGGGGGDGGGTSGGGGGATLPSLANQHLLLTFSQFRGEFEGWLKGEPEFELHVLAPNGKDTTNYRTLQCVGEHAPAGYFWDTNATTWYGKAQVLTGTQMDSYETQWPGKAWMIMALEDDDTACEIRMDKDLVGDVLEYLDDAYKHYKGLKDKKVTTPDGAKRLVGAGITTANLITALASLIKTNDELIGFAIRDSVAVKSHSVGNYAVLRGSQLNGWLRLEVKY